MQYKLITLSLRSRNRLFLPLRLSPFLCWQLHYTKMPTPNWISEPVPEPGFWPNQIFHMTSRRPQSIPLSQRPRRFTLALAPHYHHRCAMPRWPLRQNWSSRAKGYRAANIIRYFAAASRSNTQSSGWWDDVDLSPGVVAQVSSKEEEEDLGQDNILPGFCEPAHRELSLPWTEVVGENLNDASSCKVEYIVIVISHFERFNYWGVAGI